LSVSPGLHPSSAVASSNPSFPLFYADCCIINAEVNNSAPSGPGNEYCNYPSDLYEFAELKRYVNSRGRYRIPRFSPGTSALRRHPQVPAQPLIKAASTRAKTKVNRQVARVSMFIHPLSWRSLYYPMPARVAILLLGLDHKRSAGLDSGRSVPR
jgi:hypothetical protein